MWNRGHRYEERLDSRASGRSLIRYLSERYPHSTESVWREHIARGRVLVDGERAAAARSLAAGETLVWERPPWREPEGPSSFAVLHRDEHLLGVAKPRGLPTMPGGGFLERTLLARVRRLHPEASPLHRLGRGTSGVVLFTRTRAARRGLGPAWSRAEVLREYRALVEGHPEWERLVVDTRIGRVPHPTLGTVWAAHPEGKRAVSRLRRLERRAEGTLVEVLLETGRTHQIRIHLAAAGHPLRGDRLYPRGGVPAPDSRTLPGEAGYWLHATRLAFTHPVDARPMTIRCAPPPRLRLDGEGAVR